MHNKLVIYKGGEAYVSYNSMFPFVAEEIANLRPYTKYMAIGLGASDEVEDSRLEKFSALVELVTDTYNFDPSKGVMFVTKKLVLTEENTTPFEIVEVGLTSDDKSDNPKVVNRFIVNGGEPIYRDAGEEMTIEVTIYFEFNQTSTLRLTSGSNNLVKLILGEETGEAEFRCARGENLTSNNTLIERSDFSGVSYPATIEANHEEGSKKASLVLKSSMDFGVVKELLVLLNGSVVMRANATELFGIEYGLTYEGVSSGDYSCFLNIGAVAGIDSVYNKTTGAEVSGYSHYLVGTSFKGVVEGPFGNKSYPSCHKRYVDKRGKLVTFYDFENNLVDVYEFDAGSVVKRDTTGVDITNGYLLAASGNYLLVKVFDGSLEDLYPYTFNKGVYTKRRYNCNNPSLANYYTDKHWKNLDLANILKYDGYIGIMIDKGDGVCFYSTYLNSSKDILYNKSVEIGNFVTNGSAIFVDKNFREDVRMIGYDSTRNIVYHKGYSGLTSSSSSAQALAVACANGDEGFPKAGKCIFYTAVASTGNMIFYGYLDYFGKTINFGENVKKFYTSGGLDYIAVQKNDGSFDFYFVDGNLNLYPFSSGLPNSIDGSQVEDLEFTHSGVLLFMADGTNKLVIINEDKWLIGPVEKNNSFVVNYGSDSTPGVGGGIVQAVGEIEVVGN